MTQPSPVKQITEMSKRLERARQIFEQDHVSPIVGREGVYVVQGPRARYVVDVNGCNCPDFRFGRPVHRGYCKHRLAVCLYEEAQGDPEDESVTQDDGDDLEGLLADLF